MEYKNELTKDDHKMLQGIAALGMVCLHLFCRLGELPYIPLLWIKGVPLIYYIGLFGDICVPVFAFLSGYAHYLQYEKGRDNYKRNIRKISGFVLNVWIVIAIVCCLGILFDHTGEIPGSFSRVIKNLLLIDTYAGAWWYIVIYIMLVVTSFAVYKFVKNNRTDIVILIFLCLYCVTYYLRFLYAIPLKNTVIRWLVEKGILYGNTLFSYSAGMLYRKHHMIGRIKNSKNNGVRVLLVIAVFVAFIFHCYWQSVSIAPINAFIVITAFSIIDKPIWLKTSLMFIGKHSMNIWLLHMFFYMYIFKGFVFIVKYPILNLLLTLTICIFFSFIIFRLRETIDRIVIRRLGDA